MAITTIAFDLDDTLLNTTGLLVPKASKDAFSILIKHGLKLNLDECEQQRLLLIKNISHKDVFIKLSQTYGTEKTLNYIQDAVKAFYEPNIPEKLPLVEHAENILEKLHPNYNLYIVTAGFESGQRKKIKSLNIEKYFKDIFVVNSLDGHRKITAFKKILDLEKIPASQLLCVGNSLSSEIKDAKELKAVSCYFEFGEERGELPTDPEHKPDYHIKHFDQFIQTCKIVI